MDSIELIYDVHLSGASISTDTRSLNKGDIFFALKGENFNGNHFVQLALNKGASLVVMDEESDFESEKIIKVENALHTLQQLALFHRKTFSIPVIGITGSNGKTTTKELIHAVLSKKYHTLSTKGNLNNHIGVPITVLSINKSHEIAVIEMGANHIGEIGELCRIALPTYGYITNIGIAHIEGFGSFEGVKNTKRQLYEHVEKNKGTVFVNKDNPLLCELSKNQKRVLFGTQCSEPYCFKESKAEPFLTLKWKEHTVATQIIGAYNAENVMAAITIGNYFGVDEHKIIEAIEHYIPSNNRSQWIENGKNQIIMDAYNANPTSMRAALTNFSNLKAEKKMFVLGDMLELGQVSAEEHKKIEQMASEIPYAAGIFVGKEFLKLKTFSKFHYFQHAEEAAIFLKELKPVGYTILIKGSRGIKLENILEWL